MIDIINIQTKIKADMELLISLIATNEKINIGISQKTPEERISQQIEAYTNNKIREVFKYNKLKFKYLKSIQNNNGSTKAPYELLLLFEFFSNLKKEVYLDLKPINIIKKHSAPFMGTINKYLPRLFNNDFYDLYLVVKYESEVNKLPELKNINLHFVKDISNFTLYKNWQLQITIGKINEKFGTNPKEYGNTLKKLLLTLGGGCTK